MNDHTVNAREAEEQRQQLRDSVRRYAERDYPFDARTEAFRSPSGFSETQWQRFAELGWLGIGLPEELGGFGDVADQLVIAEELGRALVIEPWLANCALAGPLLAECGDVAQRGLVADLIAGRTRLALAAWERQGRFDAFDVSTRAHTEGGVTRLHGRKTLALGAGSASHLLVLARESGEARDTDGLSLFRVAVDGPGVTVRATPTYDGRHTADVTLHEVALGPTDRIGEPGRAWPAVARAIDRATLMLCAEAVGAMDRCLSLTRDYLRTRKQFGKLIIDNQVIKHRLVDLFVAIGQARAITERAAQVFDDEDAARERAVSLAKAFVGPAGRRVGEDAVQLHGAIGMTDDLEIGQCYKRLAAAANLLGDAHWHGTRILARPATN